MTWAQRWQNDFHLLRINFKLITRNNLFVSLALLFLIPFIHGVSNLDATSAANCLETYVALIGVVMLVPLFSPEQPEDIYETIASKVTAPYKVPFIRLLLAIICIGLLIGGFTWMLLINNSSFPVWAYIWGTFASTMLLGSIGMLVAAISNNTIIGYMASIGYLIVNMMTKDEYVGPFFLMSMTKQSFTEKYWLLAGSVVLITLSFMIKPLVRKYK